MSRSDPPPKLITTIPTRAAIGQANMLKMLREMLADAERGELRALAIVSQQVGGNITTCFEVSDGGSYFTLLGALAHLQARLLRAVE
jgi:hypothetical protein